MRFSRLVFPAILATCALALASCGELSPEQEELRSQGRPFLIAESDGLKAYRWDVPDNSGGTEKLYFIPGGATTWNCGDSANCYASAPTRAYTGPTTADSRAVGNSLTVSPGTPNAANTNIGSVSVGDPVVDAALNKLTPEERAALGLTRAAE